MDAAQGSSNESAQSGALRAERDREILEFERQWWKYAGAKETAIREPFDMSATRYYQVLNALIDSPEALEADPLLVAACAGCGPAPAGPLGPAARLRGLSRPHRWT